MIQKTKCRSCGQTYEIIWGDEDLDDWYDEDELLVFDDQLEKEDDPVYCPFCSLHCDYDE